MLEDAGMVSWEDHVEERALVERSCISAIRGLLGLFLEPGEVDGAIECLLGGIRG